MLKRLTRNVVRPTTLVGMLLRSIVPVVALVLLVVIWGGFQVSSRQVRSSIDDHVQRLAQDLSRDVERFHQDRARDLQSIAEVQTVYDIHRFIDLDALEEAENEIKVLTDFFQTVGERTPDCRNIAFIDREGQVLAEYVRPLEVNDTPVTYPSLDSISGWARAKEGYLFSPIGVNGDHKVMTFARSYSYNYSGKELGGTILLICDLDEVEAALKRAEVGAQGVVYLRDKRSEWTLGSTGESSSTLRAELSLKEDIYRLVVVASEEEFLAPLRSQRNITIYSSILLLVLVCVLLYSQVKRHTRPLGELVEGTRRLASGDLDYRFPLPKLQDLQDLAFAFNDMAGNLKQRSESLQDRVRQLTALRMMDQSVLQRLDEEQILRTTLQAVSVGLGFDRAGLYWVDEQAGKIVGRYSYFNFHSDFTEQDFRTRWVPLGGRDILNRVVSTRQPQLVLDPVHTEGVDPGYVRAAGTRQFVMAPLLGKDNVYGVITADNCHTNRPLGEGDREELTLFASAAGMALENSRLVSRVAVSEARHRAVLDNSPVAILALSRDHKVLTWNFGAEAIFGYPPDQIVGQPIRTLIPEEALDAYDRLLSKLLQEGSVHEFPLSARTREGKPLEIAISWGGRHLDFASNDEWAVVIRDVTEARKLQEQLVKSEKLTAVGQLISGIAHELNNPLQTVIGYADFLSGSPGRASHAELRRLNDSAQRCRRIIDNLLLFVRHGDVQKGPVNLRDATSAAFELLAHKLRQCRVEYAIHPPRGDGPWVTANFQQTEQVFMNLISNACDAMRDRPGPNRVEVRIDTVDHRARVTVRDNGPGVPPEARQTIFEPFYTTKGAGQGTGLGLHICRQIIHDHGGDLRLLTVGPGAAFEFELPLCSAPPSKPLDEPAQPAATHAGRILIVDDEPEVRALIQDVLESQGHSLVIADSFASAVERVAEERFDLIVSDIHLNDGNGMELCNRWDRITRHARPRILFLTGDLAPLELECQATGCESRVLQKPMDLRVFRAAVIWGLEPTRDGGAARDPAGAGAA